MLRRFFAFFFLAKDRMDRNSLFRIELQQQQQERHTRKNVTT